jgi:hypothetical protein
MEIGLFKLNIMADVGGGQNEWTSNFIFHWHPKQTIMTYDYGSAVRDSHGQ